MKGFWVAFLLLTIPALALHASDVAVLPQMAGVSKDVAFVINATNLGTDNISEVRISVPIEFSGLACGAAPGGWKLVSFDVLECSYKTVSAYLAKGDSLVFSVNATTAAGDGNYTWEIRSRDVFDGFSLHAPVTAIDGTLPSIRNSTMESPNGGEKWETLSEHIIRWRAEDIADSELAENPITLEYTADGKAWILIASDVENNGTYMWTLPNLTAEKARVRITATDAVGNLASDASDDTFSIIASLPTVSIKVGESKTVDVNGKNATITVRGVKDETVTLLIKSAVTAQPVVTPKANATASPAATVAPNNLNTAVVVVLVVIILYLIWRLQQIEKKKAK